MAEKKRYKSPFSGMARRFSGAGGLSGSGRGVVSGIADQPVPGYRPPEGPMPLDRLAAALKPGAMRGTASSLSGLGGLSGAARGMTAGELATAVAGAPSAMASALTQMVPGARAYSSGIGGQRSSQLTQPPRQPLMTMQPQTAPDVGGTIPGLTAGLDAIIDRARMRAGGLPGGVQGPLPPTGQGLADPRRVRAIADMYGLAGIQVPPMASQIAGAERERTFIDQLEAQRLAGRGIAARPTPQERSQFASDVAARIQQSPNPINQFLGQELMGRTREGQQMGMRDLQQGFLARPIQGGMFRGSTADTMRDREQRLSMLEAGRTARAQQAEQVSSANDQAWRQALSSKLEELGYDQATLNQVAEKIQDRRIAEDPAYALGRVAPGGTVVRVSMPGEATPRTFVKGYEQSSQRREQRLAGLPARIERDRLAVANRLDRMRAGRQAMMANQQAAQRQAMDMATNPIANPMLLAGNPVAQAEAMRIGQQQREFAANAPSRMLDAYEQMLRTRGLELQNLASERMMSPEFMQQQQQQQVMQNLMALTPEAIAALGPAGLRRLQQQAFGDQQGATPQSVPEAVSTVQSLAPDISAMLGGEDPANLTSNELLEMIRQRQSLGLSLSPQDNQALLDYARSRSMYDTNFLNQ